MNTLELQRERPKLHTPPRSPVRSKTTGLRVIARLLSMLLAVLGVAMIMSIGWTLFYGETQATRAFAFSIAITLFSCALLYMWGRNSRSIIYRREALAVVGLGWVLIGIYGALPYWLAGTLDHFADAYFEATSGFTTTGATVIEDVEVVSHGLQFWRMMTHWLGGMGIIVLFTALFAQLGVGAKQLLRSEVPGPITDALHPKIRETALAMWKIYAAFTAVLSLLLVLLGMSPFDAICHGFATMATGGYSNYNSSISHFHSAAIEMVIAIFMFMAGINFTLYHQVIRGHWRSASRNSELHVYSGLIFAACALITFNTYDHQGENVWQALRYASFQVVSIITTTGFGTDDFDAYPTFSKFILLCLMFVGGCAGSTAGGMKVSRIIVLFKVVYQEIYQTFRPHMRVATRVGRVVVAPEVSHSILVFTIAFFLIFVGGSLFMTYLGLDLTTSITAVIACLGNIGPGLGQVGPTQNYAALPSVAKVFLSFCMLLGRLELTTLLVLLMPSFWLHITRE